MIDDRLDFDAFCSALTMRHMLLRDYNISLRLTYLSTIPEYFTKILLAYVDPTDIEVEKSPTEIDFSKHDVVLFLDSAEKLKPANFSKFEIPENIPTINIDHHMASNPCFGSLNIVRDVPSTCSLLYEIFSEAAIVIDKHMAQLLLLGILDDTQVFTISGVRPKDLETASDLLKTAGLEMFDIVRNLTWSVPIDLVKLNKIVYEHLTVDYEQKVAYSYVLLSDMKKQGVDPSFSTNLSPADELKRIDGIDVAFLIKEKSNEQGIYSISFRSRNPLYNVSDIASSFGGGGHSMASGGIMRGVESMDQAIENILGVISAYRLAHKAE